MSITGFLSDFSLSEIFRFIEQGHKTGRLMVCTLPQIPGAPAKCHYIWVDRGRIVAAANRTDGQGLISLIAQQGWFSNRLLAKLIQWCCPVDKPLGLCLKNHCILQDEQLQQLFLVQILQHLCALSQINEGHFNFEQNLPLPGREMTGLNVSLKIFKGNYSQTPVLQLSTWVQLNALLEKESGVRSQQREDRSQQINESIYYYQNRFG
jgi:hypothetical protein